MVQGDFMLDPAYRIINDDNALGGYFNACEIG